MYPRKTHTGRKYLWVEVARVWGGVVEGRGVRAALLEEKFSEFNSDLNA